MHPKKITKWVYKQKNKNPLHKMMRIVQVNNWVLEKNPKLETKEIFKKWKRHGDTKWKRSLLLCDYEVDNWRNNARIEDDMSV